MIKDSDIISTDVPRSTSEIKRPKIAFFDYPDVFEDFYTHYGISQTKFSTWQNTANHAWLKIIQQNIGDVTWYITCIKPELRESIHESVGCKLKFLKSSLLHRVLWKTFYLPSFSWRWRKFYRSYATIASYLAPISFSLLKALYKDKPDVIFVQDYCSGRYDILLITSWILKIPLVTLHSGSTADKYLGKSLKKITIPRARWIFSSGTNETNNLKIKYHVDQSQINIIRPPIDIDVYRIIKKETACLKLNLSNERRYLLFIGRFEDAVKRISSIIAVFHKLAPKYADVDLLIVGGGKDEQGLKYQAEEMVPGRINFTGWVSSDDVKALYYNISECQILASWREASPAVIGEAFSCGIPVVSSDVGGIDDLVKQEESGWLFPPGDDEELFKHLDYVLANPEKIMAMRRQIRKIAEEKVSIPSIESALQHGFSTVLNNLN